MNFPAPRDEDMSVMMVVGWRRLPFRLCAWWCNVGGKRVWLATGGDA